MRAAVDLADAEGLPAVSMARVAEALGYSPMALYRYVESKDELLVLMADAAADVLELPRTTTTGTGAPGSRPGPVRRSRASSLGPGSSTCR